MMSSLNHRRLHATLPERRRADSGDGGETARRWNYGFLQGLENHLKQTGGRHLAGDKLTWADIRVADTLFRYDIIGKNLKDECLATKAFVHRIHDLPELREYVKNRDLSRNF
ncbi:hypothetical protein QR680_010316 [Steinernema hermaphroditum]|uniref:GST C-terminal domain-containing protein n=1 Tax=Steinernema hermaphroditum TaxID=289476 RepID=A0AA39INJ3_9BILA|nr:hypothetical protein QR680_010316 [Steinernema hermaphroditum]